MLKSTSQLLHKIGFSGPGILIDDDQARINIRAMAEKARRADARFRPHFKTHQSAEVGGWFAEEGVTAITVSSVAMAEYFAKHGWYDITIAFLLNPLEGPRIIKLANHLAALGGRLALTIDSTAAATWLVDHADCPLGVWLKIDTGYGRTGIPWQNKELIQTLVDQLAKNVPIHGLLTHSGNSYQAASKKEIETIWQQTLERMKSAKTKPELAISVGDTPCCRVVADLSGVQEIRPGNFVFFDLMQWSRGVCRTEELAAAAVCPVVGLYPHRRQIVLQGGAVHLSKESLIESTGQTVFGYLGTLKSEKEMTRKKQVLTQAPVVSLSQEHGIIEVSNDDFESLFADLVIGDLVLVWPVHSCLACDLAAEYQTLSGQVLTKK